MSRDVPYDKDEKCDICGKQGAFDFMGDFICENCLEIYMANECDPLGHNWRESFLKRYCALCGKEQRIDIENLIWFLEELRGDWQWKKGYLKYKKELEILNKTLNELKEIRKTK